MAILQSKPALLVPDSENTWAAAVSAAAMTPKAVIDGTDGDDLLDGTGQNDTINGYAGNDTLKGLGGDDALHGGSGSDVLEGGDGNDWLDADDGDEWDDDTLYGGAGDDILSAGYGNDRLYGGDGNDVLVAGYGGQTFDGDELFGGAGNDTLIGSGILRGDSGDDTLLAGDAADWLYGDAGADTIDGGGSDDRIDYRGSNAGVAVDLAAGTGHGGDAEGDTLRNIEEVRGTSYSDIINGNDADNNLFGYGGRDTFSGAGGNDHIIGGAGRDILDGGAGDDRLDGRGGADQIDGGAGTDTMVLVSFDGVPGSVSVDLAAGTASGGEIEEGFTFSNIENVVGTQYADVLTGDGNDNYFEAGGGADHIDGGAGSDTVLFYSSPSVFETGMTINLAAGTLSGGGETGHEADGGTIADVEHVTAGFNDDVVIGDDGDNILSGSAGADTISGGAGNDTIEGGEGAYSSNNIAPVSTFGIFPPYGDTLDGGAGADRFVFRGGYDSDINRADVIEDFTTSEGDKIDLSPFYAEYPEQGEPVALTFIGYGDFSGEAGQLRLVQDGAATDVQIDVNGDQAADFAVTLADVTETLDADAFVL